jgi:hypothetical protein
MRLLRSIRLNWGLRPQTPGIYRFRARMVCHGGGWSRLLPFRLLSRRSGCVPALPYPPLRYFQSGSHQPRRAMIFHRTATTPLTFCLTRGVHPTETFNFLGFTHICGTNRKTGKFTVHRRTMGKRMAARLKELRVKLRQRMHARPKTT